MFLCACFLPACQWPLYTDGGIPLLSNCKFALTMIKWDVLSQNTNVCPRTQMSGKPDSNLGCHTYDLNQMLEPYREKHFST
jgi:hypothetical protein